MPRDTSSNQVVGIVDFYANLARLAGVEGDLPSDRDIDSIDQTDLFLGKSEKSKR